MERSNLATPFTRAFVVDPSRIAPVGLALSVTVTVPATFASCRVELRNETVTGKVAPGRAYGKTSTSGDEPAAAVPTLATSRPVSSACSSDGACAPQAFTTNDATTSAPRYFSRFTSCSPGGRRTTARGRLSGEHPVEVGHFHVVGAAPAGAGGRTGAPAGARTRASCDRAAARSLRARRRVAPMATRDFPGRRRRCARGKRGPRSGPVHRLTSTAHAVPRRLTSYRETIHRRRIPTRRHR